MTAARREAVLKRQARTDLIERHRVNAMKQLWALREPRREQAEELPKVIVL